MSLETDLEKMAEHLVDRLKVERLEIKTEEGKGVFGAAGYGEPRTITTWPYCSVQPINKVRTLRGGGTRKFRIEFSIDVYIYHGQVADTQSIQQETHKRAEALDLWFGTDYKWNFIDSTDSTKDKVIFGYVTNVDHPVVIAPMGQLWSASRLQLTALSEEIF